MGKNSDRVLYISVFINAFISIIELIFGLFANSLSLISDALHNFLDFFAVFLALVARIFGRKPPSLSHTYGFRRIEIISAFFNAILLFSLMLFVLKESLSRLINPVEPPNFLTVIIVGTFAFIGNFISVITLSPHKKEDINIKTAFYHLFQDSLVSLIVVISAFLYRFPFGKYVDPFATIVISIFIIKTCLSILLETLTTLLEGVPFSINLKEILDFVLNNYPDLSIHHIHLWQNGPNEILFTAHIKFNKKVTIDEIEESFKRIKNDLESRWKINHITLEPEFEGCADGGFIPNRGSKGTKI